METPTLDLVRSNVREELDSNKIARDILAVIIEYQTIVLEETIISRNRGKYSLTPIKRSLGKLVSEGLLDTGSEGELRWYYIRRECKNHFTGEINPDEKFRSQLIRFIELYDEEI
jgi:hypothetical protein